MTIDRKLVELLRCPVTGQAVRLVSKDRLAAINEAVAGGSMRHPDGRPAEDSLESALETVDGARIYPVRDGIPVMLEEECIMAAEAKSA